MSAAAHDATRFAQELTRPWHVVNQVAGDHEIEHGGGKGQLQRVHTGNVKEWLPRKIGEHEPSHMQELMAEPGAASDVDADGIRVDVVIHPCESAMQQAPEVAAG